MHRYVDLHYQYLTSSYACMLSCPISLRPFVILEGTGLRPWGAQGQSGGGVVSPAPICGRRSAFLTVNTPNTDAKKKQWHKSVLFSSVTLVWVQRRGKLHWVGVARRSNILSRMKHNYFENRSALTQFKNWSMCFQDPSKLCANQRLVFIYPESHFEYHCVGICSFLCHYREISMSSWEKGARKYMTTNCLFCGRYSEHVD